MYIPPGFTVITCEPIDEEALQTWALSNCGIWHPATEGHYGSRRAYAEWGFGPHQNMEARCKTLTEDYKAEWIPRERMHKPPQSIVDIEIYDGSGAEGNFNLAVLHSLFAQWDNYAYDLGADEWVSALLRDLLPSERIIRREPPPPGPLPAWIWVNGKYTQNELYEKNEAAQ